MESATELKVFIALHDPTCDECGVTLPSGGWITPVGDHRALCLGCAGLDHLLFLAAGDAALTRRARQHSTLAAVVLKWSRARKRYERQGLLVEAQALEQAERECLADADARARRQEREAMRGAALDQEYVQRFAARVRALFPRCPPGRETVVAEHACLKYSGRVGRTLAAKEFDETAVRLAVIAHIRHSETDYERLLGQGCERQDARAAVADVVAQVLARWAAVADNRDG